MGATLDAKIRLNSSEFQGGLNRAVIAANSAVEKMSAQFSTLQRVASFGIIGNAVVSLGEKILKATINFEKYKRQLTIASGGASAAAVKFKELQTIAAQPGLSLDSVVDAQIRLKEIGYTSDEATKHIQTLGRNIAAFGGGGEEMKGVILSFSQISSKGQVFAEEINQIAERLPTVRRLMKEAFGTSNAEEIQKMGISAKEFTDKMLNGMQNAQPVAEGLAEAINKIKILWEGVLADESGTLANTTSGIASLAKNLLEAHKNYVIFFSSLIAGDQAIKDMSYAMDFNARMEKAKNDATTKKDAAAAAEEAERKKKEAFAKADIQRAVAAISAREKLLGLSLQTRQTDEEKLQIVEKELEKIRYYEDILKGVEKAREDGKAMGDYEVAMAERVIGLLGQKKTLEQSIIDIKAAALKKEVQREMMTPQERRQADRQARAEGRAAKRVLNRDLNKEVNKQWKEAEKRGMGDPVKEAGKQAFKRQVAEDKQLKAAEAAKEAGFTLKQIYTVLQGLAAA
jgi:tape measure domain-containing protein